MRGLKVENTLKIKMKSRDKISGGDEMYNEPYISESIAEAFKASGFSLWMMDFRDIYEKIALALPPRNISFSDLSVENTIACEVICAAICHQINWDFLRNTIYQKTIQDNSWLIPRRLANITSIEVKQLLGGYNKPERTRVKNRCSLLRSLGGALTELGYNYSDIFFTFEGKIKSADEIMTVLNSFEVFSSDPEGKKTQLLLQNLSDYSGLRALSDYCKPAIDYHIIREFLRRGLVQPKNQNAYDFIFNPNVQRKEQTVGALRKVCSEEFYNLQWITSFDIVTLNTIEWWIGRSICLKESPDCGLRTDTSQWLKPHFEKCPFYDSCYAIQVDNRFLHIVEPNYQGSSY